MSNGIFNREQEAEIVRVLRHELANAGLGLADDRREATQRGFYWLNERRLGWETEEERKDRDWVRQMREASGKKNDGMRQVVVSVGSAVLGAIALYLLAHLGMK